MSKTKQVLVLRKDLNMRKGKMIAQGAHASNLTMLNEEHMVSKRNARAMRDWLDGSFTKVCVGVNSEEELLNIYSKAKEAGLTCSLIQDNGTTEFGGVPTYTAVAVGPAFIEDIDPITGDLELL